MQWICDDKSDNKNVNSDDDDSDDDVLDDNDDLIEKNEYWIDFQRKIDAFKANGCSRSTSVKWG